MWSEYFPLGKVVGVDKNTNSYHTSRLQFVNNGAYSRDNVLAVEGNATVPSIVEVLAAQGIIAGFADVVVNDANHWARERIGRFEICFPRICWAAAACTSWKTCTYKSPTRTTARRFASTSRT